MEKGEINLENPIFVLYINVENISRQRAEEMIDYHKRAFNYSNVTMWVIASDKTEVQCVFEGTRYRKRDNELSDLIREMDKRIDILSESTNFEDFKKHVRNWRLENLIKDNGDNQA